MAPLTADERAAARADAEQASAIDKAATPGPWVVPKYDGAEIRRRTRLMMSHSLPCICFEDGVFGSRQVTPETLGDLPDATFVSQSRALLPRLADAVLRLLDQLDAAERRLVEVEGRSSDGGKAAAANMTPEERTERARKAARSRWQAGSGGLTG